MSAARPRVQSMTGYGRAAARTDAGALTVELRSTNHRYLEIDQRLPNGLTALHASIAEQVRRRVQRGRVDVLVTLQAEPREQRQVVFDEALLTRYHEALVGLKTRFGVKGAITLDHLLALPQAVLVTETRKPLERIGPQIVQATDAAVRELVRARQREGAKLAADLLRLLRFIEAQVKKVTARLPKALEQQRRRVRERLLELLDSNATGSRAQVEEVAALLKEADVHEEVVRLHSHVTHVRQALTAGGLVGKQLDFIAQELMRETNTLGAKVNDAEAARHVVQIKGAIEKVREQVQNLE